MKADSVRKDFKPAGAAHTQLGRDAKPKNQSIQLTLPGLRKRDLGIRFVAGDHSSTVCIGEVKPKALISRGELPPAGLPKVPQDGTPHVSSYDTKVGIPRGTSRPTDYGRDLLPWYMLATKFCQGRNRTPYPQDTLQ